MKISPPLVLPLLALLFVIYLLVFVGGVDGAYLLSMATFPFSLMWMVVVEIAIPPHEHQWINMSLLFLLTMTLVIEAYVVGRMILGIRDKFKK